MGARNIGIYNLLIYKTEMGIILVEVVDEVRVCRICFMETVEMMQLHSKNIVRKTQIFEKKGHLTTHPQEQHLFSCEPLSRKHTHLG